jgi:hypothetical protein
MRYVLCTMIVCVTMFSCFEVYTKEGKTVSCDVDNNLVTLYNKNHTKAKLTLTCNGQQINIGKLNVGYIAYKENKRVFGLDKKEN